MAPSTGLLPPDEAASAILQDGLEHLSEPLLITFIQNIYGALLMSSAGLLSIILGAGFAGIADGNNPGIQRLLQGAAFPLGLVLVYLVGAELFTGYPMWFTLTALERKGKAKDYVKTVIASWVGNVLGALLFCALFVKATRAIDEDPWRSSIVSQVTDDIVEMQWHVIFLRAIGCGWLVTLAMFLGTQNQDGISKILCLHFPFLISTTARFPHTVEYMFLSMGGMMLGAPLGIGGLFWKCLLPITLGNTLGGAVFTGGYLWLVHLPDRKSIGGRSNGILLDDSD